MRFWGVTRCHPRASVRDVSQVAFFDYQKHIMFLQIMGVTRPTSQHFRVAISRNCNTSRLLLRFWGGGNPGETRAIRSRRLEVSLRLFQEMSIPPSYFCISGGEPWGNPRHLFETSRLFWLSYSINLETSRSESWGYQVTLGICSRRLEIYSCLFQEMSIPPIHFAFPECSPLTPGSNPTLPFEMSRNVYS